jgi:nicotinate-nucleotide--dimethylbenzimidazole phosphoribosyltransferase
MSAQAHLDGLAKPVGSLGLLEFYAIRLCKLQDTLAPVVIAESLAVFCADHGAARPTDVGGEAVSAFPSSVTAKIVTALAHGDAAGSVIAASLGIPAERRRIVDVGVDWPPGGGRPPGLSGVGGKGTRNFAVEEAMSLEDCLAAERAGAETVRALAARHATNVVALGEGTFAAGDGPVLFAALRRFLLSFG